MTPEERRRMVQDARNWRVPGSAAEPEFEPDIVDNLRERLRELGLTFESRERAIDAFEKYGYDSEAVYSGFVHEHALNELIALGFDNVMANRAALNATDDNIREAIELLTAGPPPPGVPPVVPLDFIDTTTNAIDVIGADGDRPRTRIQDFINDNGDSIILNIISAGKSIKYLFSRAAFMHQLRDAGVYPCTTADRTLRSIQRHLPMYTLGSLINRRFLVPFAALQGLLAQPGSLYLNIVPTDQTYLVDI